MVLDVMGYNAYIEQIINTDGTNLKEEYGSINANRKLVGGATQFADTFQIGDTLIIGVSFLEAAESRVKAIRVYWNIGKEYNSYTVTNDYCNIELVIQNDMISGASIDLMLELRLSP